MKVYRRPDDGTYLQPKHVAANKLIKLGFVCNCFGDSIFIPSINLPDSLWGPLASYLNDALGFFTGNKGAEA